MDTKSRIWKFVVLSGWIILGLGLVFLFVAAMQSRSGKPCKDVSIVIKGGDQHPFISTKDVIAELEPRGIDYLRGRSVKEFNLKKLEDGLQNNPWVRNAELFFDNNDVLRVSVDVKMPLARIFTVKGNSFYVDSSLSKLPLSERYSPRLPVFTGFPSEKINSKKDSVLLRGVKDISNFLNTHPFWMAQVDQIDINADRKFEMIPKVGDHIIVFGNGEDITERFHKLEVFYSQVMSRSGWNDYSALDVQYKEQIVATKRTYTYHKSDTAVEKRWMKEWQKISGQLLAADTLQRVAPTADSVSTRQPENPISQPMTNQPSEKNPDPGKNKNSGSKGSVPAERPKPKALYAPGKKQT